MAGVERVAVHVSRLAHCPAVFFVEFSRAGSVGNLVGQLLDVDGLSMGELVTVNREIARAIREAKHARHL